MSEESKQAIRKTVGQTIKNLRQVKNISQEELATLAGVHRTYIGMVERGEKNVTIVTLHRLSEALGVPPAELLKGFGRGE